MGILVGSAFDGGIIIGYNTLSFNLVKGRYCVKSRLAKRFQQIEGTDMGFGLSAIVHDVNLSEVDPEEHILSAQLSEEEKTFKEHIQYIVTKGNKLFVGDNHKGLEPDPVDSVGIGVGFNENESYLKKATSMRNAEVIVFTGLERSSIDFEINCKKDDLYTMGYRVGDFEMVRIQDGVFETFYRKTQKTSNGNP